MEPLRRHFSALDQTSWTGLVVLGVGILGGAAAIGSRVLPESFAIDVPVLGGYAAVFIVVGIVLYLRGD